MLWLPLLLLGCHSGSDLRLRLPEAPGIASRSQRRSLPSEQSPEGQVGEQQQGEDAEREPEMYEREPVGEAALHLLALIILSGGEE